MKNLNEEITIEIVFVDKHFQASLFTFGVLVINLLEWWLLQRYNGTIIIV